MEYPARDLLVLADAIAGFYSRDEAFKKLRKNTEPALFYFADAVSGTFNRKKALVWLGENKYPELALLARALQNETDRENVVDSLREDDYPELAAIADMCGTNPQKRASAAQYFNENDLKKLFHFASVLSGTPDRVRSAQWLFDCED